VCGIAGGLFFDPRFTADVRRDIGERLLAAIRHRGPDGEGVWSETVDRPGPDNPAPLLVHSRLAIIDTSPAGAQPMNARGLGSWVTFNGEIYNFARIRPRLEAAGHAFDSRTDTEVILRGYATWGPSILQELRGMFALGIWNAGTRDLFLARDRFGIKPLYVARGDGWFLFASEVRALLATGLVEPTLDLDGLWQYLAYQTTTGPRTLIDGIEMVDPGSWLRVGVDGREECSTYWDLATSAAPLADATPEQVRQDVHRLLLDSVTSHLVSDVPVGAFLSGGIDSSAVVALMREAGVTPRTFSVGFAEAEFDESAHAEQVAAVVGSEHTAITLGEQDLLDTLPEALAAMDQPTGDGVNTYVVSRAVRRTGLTVALSGLGGDELFAGYPSFSRLPRAAEMGKLWGRSSDQVRGLAGRALRLVGGTSVAATKAAAAVESDGSLAALYPLTRQLFTSEQRLSLVAPAWRGRFAAFQDPYVPMLKDAFARMPAAGLVTQVSYAESRTYMHDVLLRDTDQMSMAHALEVRVPLIDHVLADYVMAVPDPIKAPGATPKPLLVESLGSRLPREIVHRPKRGFTLPFEPWMRNQLRGFCENRLGAGGLAGRGLFDLDRLAGMWTSFQRGGSDVTWSRLWILVTLETWLARHKVRIPSP
jgi:asparagine synthase (glutamine-hydrolysing)